MERIETWLAGFKELARSHWRQTQRPLVTLTYAQSLDGCIAARPGEQTHISGAESLRLTHQLRAVHTCILVGVGTILADDPRLNVRLVPGPNPRPVILDSHLRTPPTARLFTAHREPWIVAGSRTDRQQAAVLEAQGAQVWQLDMDDRGHIPLENVLDLLGHRGVESIMVEGARR